MKFTDGFWRVRTGVRPLYAEEAYDLDVSATSDALEVTAPTTRIRARGDVLNRPTISARVDSPLEGVVRVRLTHFAGSAPPRGFAMPGAETGVGKARLTDEGAEL